MINIKKIGKTKSEVINSGLLNHNNYIVKSVPTVLEKTPLNQALPMANAALGNYLSGNFFTGGLLSPNKRYYDPLYSHFKPRHVKARVQRGTSDTVGSFSLNDYFLGTYLLNMTSYQPDTEHSLPYTLWGNPNYKYLGVDASVSSKTLFSDNDILCYQQLVSGETNYSGVRTGKITLPDDFNITPTRNYGDPKWQGVEYMPTLSVIQAGQAPNYYDVTMMWDETKQCFVGTLVYDVQFTAYTRTFEYNAVTDKWSTLVSIASSVQSVPVTVSIECDLFYEVSYPEYMQLNAIDINGESIPFSKNPNGYEYGYQHFSSIKLFNIGNGTYMYEVSTVQPPYPCALEGDLYNTLNQLIVRQVFDETGALISEEHVMSQSENYPDFINYYDLLGLNDGLAKILTLADTRLDSYGVKSVNGQLIIPRTNLTGLNSSGESFVIDAGVTGQLNTYSFIRGVYCYIVDPINKLIYITLRNGAGYYLFDLNEYTPTGGSLAYFAVLDDSTIRVGYYIENDFNIIYYDINYELILIKINQQKISYDLKKINVSFLPCQTHCMGKGGIITKV